MDSLWLGEELDKWNLEKKKKFMEEPVPVLCTLAQIDKQELEGNPSPVLHQGSEERVSKATESRCILLALTGVFTVKHLASFLKETSGWFYYF